MLLFLMGDSIMNKPVCEKGECECDAPRVVKVNPIKFFLSVLCQMVGITAIVFIAVGFIFRHF